VLLNNPPPPPPPPVAACCPRCPPLAYSVSQDFICCSGPATDDSCLRNSTYGYSNPDAYDTYKREDSPSFMDAMLTPQIAAVCTFAPVLPLRCPEWAQQWVGPNLSPGCVGGVTVKW
jgi:hypothetical protein